ncbi:MAG: hypothetical protein U9N10_06760 [Bacillota bacterium]|nr:hypothetical protein [Bacillota bacterium]
MLRKGNIDFTVEKATSSLIFSATSEEGFLNVHKGTGHIWAIPTKLIYVKLKYRVYKDK